MPFVYLKGGKKVLTYTYSGVRQVLYKLFLVAPELLDTLIKKCFEPSFSMDQEHIETLNVEFHFVDEHGEVPEEIRLIVLHSIKTLK